MNIVNVETTYPTPHHTFPLSGMNAGVSRSPTPRQCSQRSHFHAASRSGQAGHPERYASEPEAARPRDLACLRPAVHDLYRQMRRNVSADGLSEGAARKPLGRESCALAWPWTHAGASWRGWWADAGRPMILGEGTDPGPKVAGLVGVA